jgi:glyceraldehyde-3-phosphate dehydrogenase (NADP+)
MTLREKIMKLFPEERDVPAEFVIREQWNQTEYLVDGELREWGGALRDVTSPVCMRDQANLSRRLLGRHPLLTEQEAMEALHAAVAAYDNGRGIWPTMSIERKIQHVIEFLDQMKKKRAEVVNMLMWEIGKTHGDSQKEFDRTVDYIQDTVEALKDLDRASSRFVIEEGIVGQIRRAPLGVGLCMGPFNYPLNETFTTLIPALIMGNTVVFKPPKLGVLLYRPLLEAFKTSFPKGVVNTVYGEGNQVIPPLLRSGKIDVLAFIGSSKVADTLKKQHPAPHRLRCVLGLDAKNPAIILPDADLELTVRECVLGTLSYNGQRCTALKIVFVHSKIVQNFIDRLSEEIRNLKFGMPWEKEVTITPLPEPKKTEYLASLVDDAVRLGANVKNEAGGTINETFLYPALLYPVNRRMRIYSEEQFGPLVPVVPYDDIEEAVNYIIESNYGQQVSIFGEDSEVIGHLIDPLVNQVCRVNINSQCQRGPDTFPFTGRKDSAEGTLSVSDALRVFSIRTLVAARETERNKKIMSQIVRERKSNFLSTDFIF